MTQQSDLCFDPAARREPSKTIRTDNPVAGNNDRDRVVPAALPDRLRWYVQPFGNRAIGERLTKGNPAHFLADSLLEAVSARC